MKLETLRKRREFLRIRGGHRWSTHAFVLEAKRRETELSDPEDRSVSAAGPRFGFTVTKRLGNAVRRNRIRRRLKAALVEVANKSAKNHFDYVLVARPAAHDMAFVELVNLFEKAFERVHRPSDGAAKSGRSQPRRGSKTSPKHEKREINTKP